LPILHEQGYLIPAVNTDSVDYVQCAVGLARSIREWHPTANISLLTMGNHDHAVFDHVIQLPYGDLGGYANDWQAFAASPYRQTIKLEADMWCAGPIDHWWTLFALRDVVISLGCRDFYDRPGQSRYYRKIFDNNHLPDVYNAITYWRLSNTAREFFDLVKCIFDNWAQFRTLLKFADELATTDVVYAMAAKIMGPDLVTLPQGLGPTIVHMKKHVIPTVMEDWTKELVWERTNPGLRINTIAQWGLVHYYQKEWAYEQ
jgi:hypothetical protein